MTLRNAISYIAKLIYPEQYRLLREKLLVAYCELKESKITRNVILEKLLISGEDHRFKYHIGFDVIAIIRAFKNTILYGKREGASTIEQQIVRVLTGKFEKTAGRKIREIFLATTLSDLVPRKDLPLIYLHIAYYGTNMNGLNSVYNKLQLLPNSLIPNETAAEIVARIKYPEPYLPTEKSKNKIISRRKHLLKLYKKHEKQGYYIFIASLGLFFSM